MTTLATLDDLEAVLGRDIAGTELVRCVRLLEMADREVRRFTGQHFERATTTDRLLINQRTVRLPQRPVHDVTAVEDVNGNPVLFTWTAGNTVQVGANVIDSFAWEPWRTDIHYVDVTYDHGYDDIPSDVARICAEIAAGGLTSPVDGVRSATVDDVTVVRASTESGVRLTPTHRDQLLDYRGPLSSIAVMPRI